MQQKEQETKPVIEADRLLINTHELAFLLNCSARHIRALAKENKLPEAIRLGRSRRWSLQEIKDWLEAGGPTKRRWNAMKRHLENVKFQEKIRQR